MADRHRSVRPTPEYLVASKLRVGQVAARVYREFHGRFMAIASELGFDDKPAAASMVGDREGRGGRGRVARPADEAHVRHGPRPADRRDPPAQSPPPCAEIVHDAPVRRRGDVVPRGCDRCATPQASLGQVRGACTAMGGRPVAATGDVRGVHRADAPLAATRDDGPRRGSPARVRRLADRRKRPRSLRSVDLRRAHIERYKRHLARGPRSAARGSRTSGWPSISERSECASSASANGTETTPRHAC